jgi:CO/xanthine dehydrogenase Mo-binding subunit
VTSRSATVYRVVGHDTARNEGPDKVTGRGKYTLDHRLPGMLWMKLLRSPFAHARIRSIDASQARSLPGVRGVLTGQDVQGQRTGRSGYKDEPVLCWDTVMFVGDKVAAVLADDEDIAERALSLIQVEYEELPAVLSPVEAAKPDAPVLHPEFNSYQGVRQMERVSNVLAHLHRERGDVAQGFAEADVIVERAYTTPHQHQSYLEPHNCLVDIDAEGRVQVWMACQLPAANVAELQRLLGVEADKLVINSAYVGGSFGGKTDAIGVYLAYLFRKQTGRPVKFAMDYAEELMAANPRHPSVIRVKAGLKRDGTITAWEAEGYLGVGAYACYAPMPNGLQGALEVGGPYRTANVRLDLYHTYTNQVPCGFARAPGMPQGLWAGESHMDVCARAIGMDPYDFRLRNMIEDGEALMNDLKYQALRVKDTLTEAARAADYSSPKPKNVGRGIGVGHHSQAGGAAVATVYVNADDSILVQFSTFDTGAGSYTLMAQVVAEELGVPVERIRAEAYPNNQVGPLQGIGGSRGARVTTVAGHAAAVDARENVKRLAAEFFGWAEENIVLQGGDVLNQTSGQRVPLAEVAQRAGAPIVGKGEINEGASPYTSYGTHIVEVEVDTDTGQFRVRKWTAVHETGRIINPVAFYGQSEGGIIYGFGEAVMTETVYDESGRVTNPSFADMKLPTIRDIPPLAEVMLESEIGDGPYKVRGIGEHTNIMAAPAIANAIEDAVGVRITSLPITAEKVYRTLREKA